MSRRSYGSGSLVELRPGVWRLRVFTGTNAVTGKPMQVSRTVRTKTRGGKVDAQRALTALIAEVDAGGKGGTTAIFAVLLDAWLEHIETQGLAPSTLATYRIHVANRIRPKLGHVRLSKLTAHDLDRFYRSQVDAGAGVQTVRLIHSVISAALEQGTRWGWLKANPAKSASPPKDTRDPPDAPSVETVRAMVAKADEIDDPELGMAVALAVLTGCRRGELCGLRWSDIDWDAHTIKVVRSRVPVQGMGTVTGKTKTRSVRTIDLDPVALAMLRQYRSTVESRIVTRPPDDPWLLTIDDGTTPLGPKILTARVSALARSVGSGIHLHSLRHFSASQLVGAGVNVTTASTRMGHSTAVMLGTYAHPIDERGREAAAILGRVLDPKRNDAPTQ